MVEGLSHPLAPRSNAAKIILVPHHEASSTVHGGGKQRLSWVPVQYSGMLSLNISTGGFHGQASSSGNAGSGPRKGGRFLRALLRHEACQQGQCANRRRCGSLGRGHESNAA